MNFKFLSQFFSFRDIRNIVFGLTVILGGLLLAGITVWAHRNGNTKVAGIAAIVSLGFVLLILIFIVPPLARSASAEASQLDLPFDFTAGGAVFSVLLIIVGFAAWNTGNNLLFIVLAFLTSALIVGFFVGSACLKKLEVKMRFPEAIFAEEPTPVIVSLNNRKRFFPTYSVMTEVRGKEREKSLLLEKFRGVLPMKLAEKLVRPPLLKHTLDYFVYLPRKRAAENKTEHIFQNRGRFIIKDFELSTRFPFGLFRHRRRLSAKEAEIIIFPNISPVESEILQLPFETGKRVLARKGAAQDLLSLRQYQPQDDLRHVDWKATARSKSIMVREYAAEDECRVTLIFDTRLRLPASNSPKTLRQIFDEEQKGIRISAISKRFDRGINQAASLLAYFYDERAEIRLIIGNEIGEFGTGRAHLYKNLKILALIEPQLYEKDAPEINHKSFEELFSVRQNSYTFLLTSQNIETLPAEITSQTKVIRF